MKRHLLIITVCLLAGAVVNLAVAWALSLRIKIDAKAAQFAEVGPAVSFRVAFWTRPGAIRILSLGKGTTEESALPPWSSLRNSQPETTVLEDGRGWPALSARCRFTSGPNGLSVTDGFELPSLDQGDFVRGLRALPYRPIWPGFAINTIFYAALLWLLIPGPFVLRRLLRVRRGLCPKCAYPMGEAAVCTECGGALAGRA